LFRKTGIVRT